MDTNTPTPQTPVAPEIPAGDIPLSEVFGPSGNVQPTTAPTIPNDPPQTPQAAPQQQPQVNQPQVSEPQPIIRTKTGTVYKSVDDAVKGIEHKDSLLQNMRQQLAQLTGVDPFTGQQIQQQPQQPMAQQRGPQEPQSYLQNPQKYFEDLYNAYQSGNPDAYFAAQQRLIEEKTMAQFSPYLPVLQDFASSGARNRVGSEIQDFNTFYASNDYSDTLQKYPALAQAIAVSEQNIQYSHQLPDLYKMAYGLHQAAKVREMVQQQNPAVNPPQVRPTAAPTTPTPPQTVNVTGKNLADDADARKALIEAFENSGKADSAWKF